MQKKKNKNKKHLGRGAEKTVKSCEIMFSRCDRVAAPMKSKEYGGLRKAYIMIIPVNAPVCTGRCSQGPAPDEQLPAISG